MKALLAMIILFCGQGSIAQLQLPAEPVTGSDPLIPSDICPKENLRGKIRHILYLYYLIKEDSVTGRKIETQSDHSGGGEWYDEHQNILTRTLFRNGKEETWIINLYDDKSRLIGSVDVRRALILDSIIYNEAEKTITRYQNGYYKPRLTIYFFGNTGDLTKQTADWASGGITDVYTYEYDNKKRLISEIRHILNSTSPGDTTTYEYTDKKNVEIVTKYVQRKGIKIPEKKELVYVKEQTRVYRRYGHSDPSYWDTDSLVVSSEGSILYRLNTFEKDTTTVNYFDKSNRIVARVWGDQLGEDTYQYKFDKMGNWIEERRFENGELLHVRKRIIEYFE